MRWPPQIGGATTVVAVLLAVLMPSVLMPSGAEAAKVVNGNFESGTLNGWLVEQATEAGNWFAYSDTNAPIGSKRLTPADPVQPPPRGAYAAISDEANPDTLILYQDIALEAGFEHRLSLLAYYDSYDPIAVPTPDTLSVEDQALTALNGEVQANQQFRIDVMKPEAPLDSIDPADILLTVFATKRHGPQEMAPTKLTANLSQFAGQTVRLRIAVAAHEEVLNAGIDAVSISTTAPGESGSQGVKKHGPLLFSFDKLKAYRRKGIATLRVRVSRPGLLRAKGAPVPLGAAASAGQLLTKPVEPVTVSVGSAKTVTIHLRPTPRARAVLRQGRKLRVKVRVTFTPFGGSSEAAFVPVVFRPL